MNAAVSISCLQQLGNNPDMAAQVQTSPLQSQSGMAATIYFLNVRFNSFASSALMMFHLREKMTDLDKTECVNLNCTNTAQKSV